MKTKGKAGLKGTGIKEKDIRNQIQDYLRWCGWFVYYNLAGLGSYPGLSDLVAVRGGQVVHIEVKTPRGRQSERQGKFQEAIEAHGGTYILARDVKDVRHLDGGAQTQRLNERRP